MLPLLPSHVMSMNFNHGGFGATPRLVRQAQSGFVDQQEAQPTAWFASGGYQKILSEVRPRLAEMMNANSSDVVFLDDASSGLNAVLRSLPWQPQDVMLLTSAAYAVLPNTGKWLQKRYGIQIVQAEVHFPAKSAEAILEPVERALLELPQPCKLRLAVFDHVSSYPPSILPVARLARMVKARCAETLVLLDGAHALGQVPIDMKQLAEAGVDAYVTDGHKWLMAPKGSGALWASRSIQDILEPAIISSDNAPTTKFQDRFDYIGLPRNARWRGEDTRLHLPAGRVAWKDDGTCLWHRNCGAFDDDSLDVCRVPANTCRLAHGCSAKVCGRDCWRLDRKVFHAGDLFPSASKLRECDALDPCVVANLLGTAGFPCTDSRCSDPAAVLQVSGR